MYHCRDRDLDYRVCTDLMVADWLWAVACNQLAVQRKDARTKVGEKCKGFLSALNYIFGRARLWCYKASPVVQQTLQGIGALQRGVPDRMRPERDLLVVFQCVADQGNDADLSDRDLMTKAALLLWLDMGARAQMMRGLRPWGDDFHGINRQGLRVPPGPAVEHLRFRFRRPKGGSEWSTWTRCSRARAGRTAFSGSEARRICTVATVCDWALRREGMVKDCKFSLPNKETRYYGPCLFVHVGVKIKGTMYYPGSQNLAEDVHAWLVRAKFVGAAEREKSHLIRAHSESAVRSCALSQFTDEVLEDRLLHSAATWKSRYQCKPCTRLQLKVAARTGDERGALSYEEVLRS